MKRNLFLFVCLGLHAVYAQNTMSLSEAVQKALTNNLDLQIAGNEVQQAENNNHAGNAGMLPQVQLNVTDNPSLTNINQKFTNGPTIERNNVFSNSLGAGIVFTYTLFDGKKMFATKRKLEWMNQAAIDQMHVRIQEVIQSVVVSYSNIIRLQEYLSVLKQLDTLSKQRLEIVQSRILAGIANNSDLYLAQLDMETNKQNLLQQDMQIRNAFTQLNLLMNMKADSTYTLITSLQRTQNLQKNILDSMLKNNPEWSLAEDEYKMALQSQKEIAAAKQPLVRLNGAYNYNLSQSQAGFSLYNQSTGPQAGISLTLPLFSGNVNKSNLENAKINALNSELKKEQLALNLQAVYEQTWQEYQTALMQLQSDSFSVVTAKAYMELMQFRFSMAQNTIIELKEAQRTYENTYFRYISNLYVLKIAETELLRLTGQLVNYKP